MNCWCSCAVPPFRAPPTRFWLVCSRVRGVNTWRAADHGSGAWRQRLDLLLDAVGKQLALTLVPRARELATRVSDDLLGHMRVRPCGVFAGRRASGVDVTVLAADQIWLRRNLPARDLGRLTRQRVDPVRDVDGAGRAGAFGLPGNVTVQRPVDLESGVVVLEAVQVGP